MPNVYNEMFRYAKQYITENSIYSPKVLKDAQPNKNYPLVLIKSLKDTLYNENLDKTDQRFRIGYEVEIYTMDKPNIAKQVITDELMNLINDVFDEHYGMRRTSNREAPNADVDVYRWTMRFEAKIDENKIIYRR